MATREDIRSMLDALDVQVPQLRAALQDDMDFWVAFSIKADTIQREADASQIEWVLDSLDDMLARHGIPLLDGQPPSSAELLAQNPAA